MVLPNFLLIGAARSGTSNLHRYLGSHPQVFASEPKELNFFVEQHNWNRGLDWYAQHFESADAIGESSPSYTMFPRYPGVPERIADVVPDVRLIYLIRHPIDRIRSHYIHEVSRGAVSSPLSDIVLEDPAYLDASSYAMQLDQYLGIFERSRILIVVSEELWSQPNVQRLRICEFLGISEWNNPRPAGPYRGGRGVHPTVASLRWSLPGRVAARFIPSWVRSRVRRSRLLSAEKTAFERRAVMPARVYAELAKRLRPDVDRLRDLLGPTFDGWGIA